MQAKRSRLDDVPGRLSSRLIGRDWAVLCKGAESVGWVMLEGVCSISNGASKLCKQALSTFLFDFCGGAEGTGGTESDDVCCSGSLCDFGRREPAEPGALSSLSYLVISRVGNLWMSRG